MGFEGFRSVRHLFETGCLDVPVARGLYVVVRESQPPPQFLERSVAGWFRGKDPTVPIEVLKEKWVEGAEVLYIGRAHGPGVRFLLQQRVKRYLRFGHGKVVGHWGGRFIWQLRDHMALQVAWLLHEDPSSAERALLASFVEAHGKLPFAILLDEGEE
jgi:hypothetical protein